jgi:hypothetical protein
VTGVEGIGVRATAGKAQTTLGIRLTRLACIAPDLYVSLR